MHHVALIFVSLWGWKRIGMALIAGLIAALSVAPLHLFPALLIAFPIVIWLMDSARSQKETALQTFPNAFFIGWAFGTGYHFIGLFWIHNALLVEAELFAKFIPVVIILLPMGLGFLWGCATAIAILFWSPGIARILILSVAFAAMEFIRAEFFFTGFPWNNLGYALTNIHGLAQIASFTGVYGLIAPTVICASLPALISDEDDAIGKYHKGQNYIFCALIIALFITAWAGGTLRLRIQPETAYSDIRLRIIQPNIPQKDKWKPENQQKIREIMLDLSTRITQNATQVLENTDILIWPESALPTLIYGEETNENNINKTDLYLPDTLLPTNFLPQHTTLITGMLFARDAGVYNSALFINHENKILAHYDKFHLVPFGEYIPFAPFLRWLGIREHIPFESDGLRAGKGNKTIRINGIPPLSPLICYEAIFPSHVTEKESRPQWLLNLSNDAWFGHSLGFGHLWGLDQHLLQSRLRAIEEGLPLIRATNTGISAIFDPYGRNVAFLEAHRRGIIDHPLPLPIKKTVYAKLGNIPVIISLIFLFIGACMLRVRK